MLPFWRGRGVGRGVLFVLDWPDEANESVTQPVLKVSHLASQLQRPKQLRGREATAPMLLFNFKQRES